MRRSLAYLAWSEFWRSFRWGKVGSAGARDFVWLTLFFTLTCLLIFVGASAHNSLGSRFEEVLLGAPPGQGAPIHLSRTLDYKPGIDALAVERFNAAFANAKLVPLRPLSVEWHGQGRVRLPGLSELSSAPVQRGPDNAIADRLPVAGAGRFAEPALRVAEQRDSGGVREVSGSGIEPNTLGEKGARPSAEGIAAVALPRDASIWKHILKRAGRQMPDKPFPLVVAASRSLFGVPFDPKRYQHYRDAVVQSAPFGCALAAQLPLPSDIKGVDELKSLMLAVTTEFQERPEFHAFEVIWVDGLPLPERTAMLFPLSTVDLVDAAAERPRARLALEGAGESAPRVSRLLLREIDQQLGGGVEEVRSWASCLGAARSAAIPAMPVERWSIGGACRQATGYHEANQRIELIPKVAAPSPPVGTSAGIPPPVTPPASRDPIKELFELGRPQAPATSVAKDLAVEFSVPLPQAIVEMCRDSSGATRALESSRHSLIVTAAPKSDRYEWLGPGRIGAPCSALAAYDGARDLRYAGQGNAACSLENASAERGAAPPAKSPAEARGVMYLDGYRNAIVEMGGKNVELEKEIVAFKGWQLTETTKFGPISRSVLHVTPTYEMALVRYGVLTAIVGSISLPLVIVGLLTLLLFLWLMLATAFSHRRAQYGLLLMYGAEVRRLNDVVGVQIALSSLIGAVCAAVLSWVTFLSVNSWLGGSARMDVARRVIGYDTNVFLEPLGANWYLMLWLGITLFAVLLGRVVLWQRGITTSRSPVELLKL